MSLEIDSEHPYFAIVVSDEAPKIAICSQGIMPTCRGFPVYLSGQVGLDPKTMRLVEGGIKAETKQAIANIRAILEEARCELQNVVKIEVLLDDMKNYQSMNEVYAEEFGNHRPTRAAYAVKQLPLGAQVEMIATAWMLR